MDKQNVVKEGLYKEEQQRRRMYQLTLRALLSELESEQLTKCVLAESRAHADLHMAQDAVDFARRKWNDVLGHIRMT